MLYNFDVAVLQNKVTSDIEDSQHADGMVPTTAPEFAKFSGAFLDSPEWAASAVLIPWQIYQAYGDKEILRARYDTMKRYVTFLQSKADGDIVNYGLATGMTWPEKAGESATDADRADGHRLLLPRCDDHGAGGKVAGPRR